METNIDQFNKYTAITFAKLYESFPTPVMLVPLEMAGFVEDDIDGFGKLPDEANICKSTIKWLCDAEYIWSSGGDNYAIAGARLSPKGLEALKSIPSSLKDKKPIGEQLMSASKTGASELYKGLVNLALSEGIKLITS